MFFTPVQDSFAILFVSKEMYLKVGWLGLRGKGVSIHVTVLKSSLSSPTRALGAASKVFDTCAQIVLKVE